MSRQLLIYESVVPLSAARHGDCSIEIRGSYEFSGKINSVNNLWLDTECGINRVAIRSTLAPGAIKLTATRAGLEPGTIRLDSQPVKIVDGLKAK